MSKHKVTYKGILRDIALTPDNTKHRQLFNQSLPVLTGLKILIDIDENPKDANHDPLIQTTNNFLLNSIGLYLTVDKIDANRWSTNLAKECSLLMMDYYKSDIEFDFEEIIDEIKRDIFDEESIADRVYGRNSDDTRL